ncbi:uncharacterized protein LAESUDRAFT_660533, partial [Laetiporus sulphureus 93-53]
MSHAGSNEDRARMVVTKVVNALSAKMEIGGPMVCSYLLGFPDHYTNIHFKKFFWAPYINYVVNTSGGIASTSAISDLHCNIDGYNDDRDRVVIGQSKREIVPLNKINDYIYRPIRYEHYCLYDYLIQTDVIRRRRSVSSHAAATGIDDDHGPNRLLAAHPLHDTHFVTDVDTSNQYVLTFLGKALPRHDKGDRETYCQTMLTFFYPRGWRSGIDIKAMSESWDAVFQRTTFASHHVQVMANMNVLYECRDARDDFSAQRLASERLSLGLGFLNPLMLDSLDIERDESNVMSDANQEHLLSMLHDHLTCLGNVSSHNAALTSEMQTLLGRLRTDRTASSPSTDIQPVIDIPRQSATAWKAAVLSAKQTVIQQRLEVAHGDINVDCYSTRCLPNSVTVLTFNADESNIAHADGVPRSLEDNTISLMKDIMHTFNLNEEQQRMFGVCARHLHHHECEPLWMYLGGIGGTGKSLSIRAVSTFLTRRGEAGRFLLMAPTGSAACLISGSTYHSVLG